MAVVIPYAVLASAGLTVDEARRELAVALYARERLTEGQAAEVAGLDRRAFNTQLAERGIPIHYGVEELREDAERTLGRRKAPADPSQPRRSSGSQTHRQ